MKYMKTDIYMKYFLDTTCTVIFLAITSNVYIPRKVLMIYTLFQYMAMYIYQR